MIYKGVQIVESLNALKDTKVPIRQVRVRRWMRTSYVLRIQKKWTKRFGTRKEPCIYKISPRVCGMPGPDYFVAHPVIVQQIRAALAAHQKAAPKAACKEMSCD